MSTQKRFGAAAPAAIPHFVDTCMKKTASALPTSDRSRTRSRFGVPPSLRVLQRRRPIGDPHRSLSVSRVAALDRGARARATYVADGTDGIGCLLTNATSRVAR